MSDGTTYRLLDSGEGRKLEQIGPYVVDRQAPHAFWPKRHESLWRDADGVHHRSDKGGGHWEMRRQLPESWHLRIAGLKIVVKPTPFGHVGLFPEQGPSWSWMQERVAARIAQGGEAPRVLNLFGYTGIASLACAVAGAEVCHVDSAKGIVDWARENQRLSGLEDRSVRWIVDDAVGFCRREMRRERRYDGIIMDPPTYGRGSKKETWKIEEDLPLLLATCGELLTATPLFFHLSCHTPGWTGTTLRNVLASRIPKGDGWSYDPGEMTIPEEDGRLLPSGTVVRATPSPRD